MKMAGALAALLAVACVLVPATSANAAPAQTNAIEIAYVPPKNSVHQSIYERLKIAACLRNCSSCSVHSACRAC